MICRVMRPLCGALHRLTAGRISSRYGMSGGRDAAEVRRDPWRGRSVEFSPRRDEGGKVESLLQYYF